MNEIDSFESDTREGSGRLEAFTDGVIAIIVTLLVLEIHVPVIEPLTSVAALHGLIAIMPKLIGFLVSFTTVSIFWVNHHHFFHAVSKTNASLLWINNYLLFWLAVIPFVTAFIGDYPTIPLVVALYGFVFCMAGSAFAWIVHYTYFHKGFIAESVTLDQRKKQFRQELLGVGLYGLSALTAFIHPYISYFIFIVVPLYYFLPKRIHKA